MTELSRLRSQFRLRRHRDVLFGLELGAPEEVAAMAVFVAAEATFSTGSEFVVDGGAVVGSTLTA